MNKIKLSICIPAYNAEEWIVETLQSLLPITDAIEVIVSDNHSTDATLKKIEEFRYQNLSSKLRVIQPANHLSMAENWNFVISSASGSYVMLLSADDLISAEMCTEAIEKFEREPSVDVITFEHDKLIHEAGGKRIATRRVALSLTEGMSTPAGLILNKNPFSINFSFIRMDSDRIKKIRSKGNLFVRNTMTTDYDFWIRCALIGCKISYQVYPKGYYRVHSSNLSNNRSKMLIQTYLVIARHRKALKAACGFTLRLLFARLYIRQFFLMSGTAKKYMRLRSALLKAIFS